MLCTCAYAASVELRRGMHGCDGAAAVCGQGQDVAVPCVRTVVPEPRRRKGNPRYV